MEMSGQPFCFSDGLRRFARRTFSKRPSACGKLSYEHARRLYYPHANAILLERDVRSRSALYRAKLDAFLAKRPALAGPPRITVLLNLLTNAGGVLSVVQLVNDLVADGLEVRLVVRSPQGYVEGATKTEPVFYSDQASLIRGLSQDADMVIGTLWSTMYYVMEAFCASPSFVPAYFVQDFEPLFYSEHRKDLRRFAEATYSFTPYCFAKTPWICDQVRGVGGRIHRVPPGLDLDLFKASSADVGGCKKRILTMLRPHTPRRGAATAIAVLSRLLQEREDVEIHFFGASDQDVAALNLPFAYVNHGVVENANLPGLYGKAYLYADFSEFHGFGRTIAEAMACGTPCVVTESGGIDAFVVQGENGLRAPVGDVDALVGALNSLLDGADLRARLSGNCRESVLPFDRAHSARATKDFLLDCLAG
jgi:glycosyltransferase involved in cell wall biosynthesis